MSSAAVITGYTALSCLGTSSETTWNALCEGRIGLREEQVPGGYVCPVGRIPEASSPSRSGFLPLLRRTLQKPPAGWQWTDQETGWILCSAKGNIDTLARGKGPYSLADAAQSIATELRLKRAPTSISTACTSSLAGIILAVRMLKSGRYSRVAISGCDLASNFVLSGFNRIKAISPEVCKPYDANRKGINLATAAATVFLEWRSPSSGEICVRGEATSNDGFHISRPASDGAGLSDCILRSCSGSTPDFICGHGTATKLNDDMESEAIARSGMASIPMFSVKGQLGHTLGACGVLETIITAQCLKENRILPSVGFAKTGTSAKINVSQKVKYSSLRTALNLAVGFGGGNAAILLAKAF